MNMDRGKESYSPEDIASVRQQLADFKATEGHSWTDLERLIGDVAGTTLSAFALNKYAGDNANVAWKVNRFFVAQDVKAQEGLQKPVAPGFRMLKTSKQMMGQMRWAHGGEISVIVANPGLSKTRSLKEYARITPNAFMITGHPSARHPQQILGELGRAVGRQVKAWRTASSLYGDIRDRMDGLQAVVLVDEAQHLTDAAFDQLRAVSDATGAGLVLAGNSSVLGRIQQGTRLVEFAQIQSRVSWPQTYLNPYPEDIDMLLDAWGIGNAREREFLAKVAMLPGALRSMNQVVVMATLSVAGSDEERALGHLKAAWTQLSRQQAA